MDKTDASGDDENEIEIARFLSGTVKWSIERDGPTITINKSLSGANQQTGAKYRSFRKYILFRSGTFMNNVIFRTAFVIKTKRKRTSRV